MPDSASAPGRANPTRLVVGLFDAPPFSEPLEEAARDGLKADAAEIRVVDRPAPETAEASAQEARWTGSSLRLVERVATRLGVAVEYRTGSESDILEALARGEIDVCASPLAPTPSRLANFDFSHAYASVGLTAATRAHDSLLDDLASIADGLFARSQLRIYAVILVCALAFAFLMWLLERGRNQDFHGHPLHGFGSSLWWSVVTLATVGYGDKVPRTGSGRALASAWMLISLVLTTVFTATIVSALTLGSIAASPIQSQADLSRARLASVRGSISSDWLDSRGLMHRAVADFEEGLRLVEQESADALVGPEIVLRAKLREHPALALAPGQFTEEFMSFGLSRSLDDAFRERFDAALVAELPHAASAGDLAVDAAEARDRDAGARGRAIEGQR